MVKVPESIELEPLRKLCHLHIPLNRGNPLGWAQVQSIPRTAS